MISKLELKESIFQKISLNSVFIGISCLSLLFFMQFTIAVLNLQSGIIFVLCSIIVGISFGLTRNLIFPTSIFVIYNTIITIVKIPFLGFSLGYADVLLWISQGLFLVLLAVFLLILAMIKLPSDQNNPELTEKQRNKTILLCSIISGVVVGLFIGVF